MKRTAKQINEEEERNALLKVSTVLWMCDCSSTVRQQTLVEEKRASEKRQRQRHRKGLAYANSFSASGLARGQGMESVHWEEVYF